MSSPSSQGYSCGSSTIRTEVITSTTTPTRLLLPIFTRELLNEIEAELARDDGEEFFMLRDAERKLFRVRNRNRALASSSTACPAPDSTLKAPDPTSASEDNGYGAPKRKVLKNIVFFRGEREMLFIERRRREILALAARGTREKKQKQHAKNAVSPDDEYYEERKPCKAEKELTLPRFFPVFPAPIFVSLPTRTAAEARALLERAIRDFETSREAVALRKMIKGSLLKSEEEKEKGKGRGKVVVVDKVIFFGLGPLSHSQLYRSEGHHKMTPFREHAAAHVIHGAVCEAQQKNHQHRREESSSSSGEEVVGVESGVELLVQDPLYTDVCRAVLESTPTSNPKSDLVSEEGERRHFRVLDNFGAKGFTLIDETSVVVAHHPSFPFLEIVADMGRPAMICMRRRRRDGRKEDFFYNFRADIDTARSDLMLEEYREVELAAAANEFEEDEEQREREERTFCDNVWDIECLGIAEDTRSGGSSRKAALIRTSTSNEAGGEKCESDPATETIENWVAVPEGWKFKPGCSSSQEGRKVTYVYANTFLLSKSDHLSVWRQ
ncbi:hypothetical protein F5Y17DRAFT_456725 [Xylariaceae sp. FL0594]|nr:hypothetical protein F5Y17DRAFT_456725 [Xylariaceae sp. FL0594]